MKDMGDAVSNTVGYIDKRLATIEHAPGTWGSPECLEMQVLLLLELRAFLLRSSTSGDKQFAVRLAYIRFIKRHVENASAEFLAVQLVRQGRIEQLPRLLGQFRDEIVAHFKAEKTVSVGRPSWSVAAMTGYHGLAAPPRMGSVHTGAGR